MRARVLVSCGSIALGAVSSVVACAASEAEPPTTASPDSGGSPLAPDDGGQSESETGPGTKADGPECSAAGWCQTSLPNEDLTLKDVWPIGDRAFAIAHSPTLGAKVLEWKGTDSTWKYIDDGTQNEAFPKYVGRIWAPNENEVYYGVDPGYIYHGTRPVPPAKDWSWTRQRLKDNSHVGFVDPEDGNPYYIWMSSNYPTLGVWGTSADDVYAWFTNSLYRRKKVEGATLEWVLEYTADDASPSTEHMYFLAAAGTGPDDVWFSGTRTRTPSIESCAVLVRKKGGSYQRIADGVITGPWSDCASKDGYLLIGGAQGWLTDIHMMSPTQIVGLKGARDVVKVSVTGDEYSVSLAPVPTKLAREALNSLWAVPGDLWLSGMGVVVRGSDDIWDGGAFQISTISLTGAPLGRPLYQVRGTSNTNLWAIGVRNALHKTTP